MGDAANEADVMENSKSAVFRESESLEDAFPAIRGYYFNQGVNYREILKSFGSTGFQAANLWDAIEIVNQMLNWRLSHEQLTEDCSEEEKNPTYRESVKCKIFLGFSSNHISSGVRDDIRYLVEHHMVEVIVTEAGAIVEDIVKCLADKYCKFEDWIKPIFEIMLEEQNTKVPWTPSKVIARLGKEINNKSSYLYWAYKNDIPIFCPGLFTDPIGQMLDRHCNPGFILDIKKDITRMNNEAVHANLRKTGMIILGGGSPKHHICNANMMRNGADFSVFINTAEEFDGSDSGARPDEAVSWGKIRASAKSVKVHCDATIALPLLVAETFAASKSPRTKVHDDATIASPSLAKETFVASISQRAQQARLAATGEATKESKVIENARSVVFKESESLEDTCAKIHGYDFNKGVNYSEILKSLVSTGFQASNLGDAIETVNHMLDGRLSNAPVTKDCNKQKKNPTYKESGKCKIFLGFTSNLISSGVRDTIRYLAEHRMVDVIVTTAGGIEEDIIKCLADTYKGDFSLPGAALRSKGLNRIGNLLVPNENYCKFEDWIMPVLDGMLEEQNTEHVLWSPSKIIARLGKEINNKSSYLYWAYKNNIPVFCPALTDGSLGDMLYFHSYRNPDLLVDIMQDIKAMYSEAMHANARKTGMLILGGGLPKHHICNVNMMRDGADYAVFINTAHEFDGTDSGEPVSRDKICKFVKVHCDATIAFPLLVAETFAARRRANTSGFVYYSCLLLVMFACLLCLWFIIT